MSRWVRLRIGLVLLLFHVGLILADSAPGHPGVIPLILDPDLLMANGIEPGEDIWLDIKVSGSPNGDVLYHETDEKLWQIYGCHIFYTVFEYP